MFVTYIEPQMYKNIAIAYYMLVFIPLTRGGKRIWSVLLK